MTTLEYGTITRDATKLPQKSLEALLARGFAHFLGNEQASKVVGRIRTAVATSLSTPEKEINQADISKDQVRAYREANAEQVTAWVNEVQATALKALDEGTVGVRAAGSGIRLDPRASEMRSIARTEVVTTLKANGLKVPKGEETLSFSGGETRTMDQMITKRLELHAERIGKEADKAIAEKARKAKKVSEEAKQAGGTSAEAMGL